MPHKTLMTKGLTGKDSAEESFHLAVDCSIIPLDTKARCKSLLRTNNLKEPNLKKEIPMREILSEGTQDLTVLTEMDEKLSEQLQCLKNLQN